LAAEQVDPALEEVGAPKSAWVALVEQGPQASVLSFNRIGSPSRRLGPLVRRLCQVLGIGPLLLDL
jgi:hypothetical protein